MDGLNIRFQEILSHGHFVKGDYYLVCNGKIQDNQRVEIQTYYSFNHALQCTSHQDSNQNSFIMITPLREWTTLKIRTFIQDTYRDFHVRIDLKKNSIFVEIIQNSSVRLSNTNVAKIISCLGIKQGEKVLYLMEFNRVKICYKHTLRIFGK
jgi:hypothetical protein